MSHWESPTGAATAAALVLGTTLSSGLPAAAWLGGGAAAFVLAFVCSRRPPAAWRLVGTICTLLVGISAGALRDGGSSRPAAPDRTDTWIAGRILAWEENGRHVRLEAVQLGGEMLHPPRRIRVVGRTSWGAVPRSRWMAVRGRLDPDRGPTNPGMWAGSGLDGTLLADPRSSPRWGPGGPSPWIGMRVRLAARLHERLPGFPGRLAEAMVLGRSRALLPEEREVFRRTGASHLVAVSGLHVGLIAWLVNLCLAGLPRRGRVLGTAAAAWAYAGLAGGAPSAVRAAALISAAGAGALASRPRPLWRWLALVLPWCLWMEPGLATSVGFQLSVGAVGGILFLSDAVRPGRRFRALGPVLASLGAQWGTLPTLVNAFGAISPLALAPNLIAVPLAGLFLPAALLSQIPGPPGDWIAGSARALGAMIGSALRAHAAVLPYVLGVGPVAPAVRGLGPALMAFWFMLPETLRSRGRVRAAALGLAAGLAAAVFLPPPTPRGPWIAFLDVGQGDAMVFRMTDGSTWILDVGDDRGPGDAGRDVVAPFLRHEGIREVDGLLVSHRHRDHVGGLAAFLERVRVNEVYDAGYGPLSGTSGVVDSLFAAHGLWPCLVARGDTLHACLGGSLVALHPVRADPTVPAPGVGLNDRSLVLRLDDGGLHVVLAGDAETAAESEMLGAHAVRPARILKVGHHGSRTSTSLPFLGAVAPEVAVISTGEHNRFGHPGPETLEHLGARGVTVYRTDRDGCVRIAPGRDGTLRVLTHAPRPRTAPR